jgi:hypothetical protein
LQGGSRRFTLCWSIDIVSVNEDIRVDERPIAHAVPLGRLRVYRRGEPLIEKRLRLRPRSLVSLVSIHEHFDLLAEQMR